MLRRCSMSDKKPHKTPHTTRQKTPHKSKDVGAPYGQGFSLIELLVVLSIVGILASISYPTYQHQVARSTMSEARLYLESLATRQAESRLKHGRFLLLDELLNRLPPSDRILTSFDVFQKLSPDFKRFELLLAPKAGQQALRAMALDHWGQFESDYRW